MSKTIKLYPADRPRLQRVKEQCHYGILREAIEKIALMSSPNGMVYTANEALKLCDEIDRSLDIYDKLKEKKCE